MRKLTYLVATTIDGYLARPGGEFDFFPTGGDHIDEIVSAYPETMPVHVRGPMGIGDAANKHFDTVLMGRATYEVGLPYGITSPYAHLRQYVVSRSMTTSPAPDVTIVSGDPLAFVRELKGQDGRGIWLCGGEQLAAALRPEIDELVLKINPVVAGSGIPLFGGDFSPQRFGVSAGRIHDSGVVIMTYARQAG